MSFHSASAAEGMHNFLVVLTCCWVMLILFSARVPPMAVSSPLVAPLANGETGGALTALRAAAAAGEKVSARLSWERAFSECPSFANLQQHKPKCSREA